MGNNGARSDREMEALIRKTQKLVRKRPGSNQDEDDIAEERAPRRFVDTQGEKDVLVQDASADEIFREMKRRSF